MIYLIMIFAIYSLAVILRDLSGPFDILSFFRRKLLNNALIGVFIYNLLSCPICIGFHCGYIIYILQSMDFHMNFLFLWGLAGSGIVLCLDEIRAVFNKLTFFKDD